MYLAWHDQYSNMNSVRLGSHVYVAIDFAATNLRVQSEYNKRILLDDSKANSFKLNEMFYSFPQNTAQENIIITKYKHIENQKPQVYLSFRVTHGLNRILKRAV